MPKKCPSCGWEDSPCWKPSFQQNPNGDIEITRPDWLKDWEPKIAQKVEENKGKVIVDSIFAYFLGTRAIWIKRILAKRFEEGGMSAFNIPHESGKPKKKEVGV